MPPSPRQASSHRPLRLRFTADMETAMYSALTATVRQQVYLAGPGLQLHRSVVLLWAPLQRCRRRALFSVVVASEYRRHLERDRCLLSLGASLRLGTSHISTSTIRLAGLAMAILLARPWAVLSLGDSTVLPTRWSICRDMLTCGRIVLKRSSQWSLMRFRVRGTEVLLLLLLPMVARGSARRTAEK